MKDETPDQYAERVLRTITEAFASPLTPPFVYSKEDNYSAIVSPTDSFGVKIKWKSGYEGKLPPLFSGLASKEGTFTLQQIWALMKKAGASDSGALCSLPIIARESTFNGLADNPTSSAKGLFQGLDSSYPEAVYSEHLYDHLPMAKTMVRENRLSEPNTDMVSFYLGVFQPAVKQAMKSSPVKNFRGWFRSTNSATTYNAQYLVRPDLAENFTFHDTVLSAVSAFSAFTRILSFKGTGGVCPFEMELEVPRVYAVVGWKLTKREVPVVISITEFPVAMQCSLSFKKRHGEDTIAMMRDPKHKVVYAASQSRSLGSPVLATEVPIDMGEAQGRSAALAKRSERHLQNLPAVNARRVTSIKSGHTLSGFGVTIKTTYE